MHAYIVHVLLGQAALRHQYWYQTQLILVMITYYSYRSNEMFLAEYYLLHYRHCT
jgi:hypothetical protein